MSKRSMYVSLAVALAFVALGCWLGPLGEDRLTGYGYLMLGGFLTYRAVRRLYLSRAR